MANLTKSYNVRLEENLLEEAKKVAKQNGANFSEWVRALAEQAVLLGHSPLADIDELKTEKLVQEFRDDVYKGYMAMREGRYMSLEELEKRVEQW